MRACICTCARASIHIYTHIDTQMRTHTHAHRIYLRAHANAAIFDADLEKMPCRTRKRPQRPKSSFEHKPWKLQNGVKVTNVLYF